MLVNVWAVWFNHCLVKSVISFVPQGALGELPSASVTVWESLWFTVFIFSRTERWKLDYSAACGSPGVRKAVNTLYIM